MIDMPELDAELQMANAYIEHICRSNSETMQKVLDWVLAARGKQITLPAIHSFSHPWNGSELKQLILEIKNGLALEFSAHRIVV